MSKNFIPQIAEMLGLQLGEEFKVKGHAKLTYRFASDRLKLTSDNSIELSDLAAKAALIALISGTDEIIKLPWKPREGEKYWTFGSAQLQWNVTSYCWYGNPDDVAMFKAGWVYRTREEAEAALPNIAKEFGVKYEL